MSRKGDKFQQRAEISRSGPILIAECDCHGCEGSGDLNSEVCRFCVFSGLGGERRIDWVILKKSYHRIYPTPKISDLANKIARFRTKILDRDFWVQSDTGDQCESCISRKVKKLENFLPELMRNPHKFSEIKKEIYSEPFPFERCESCIRKNFLSSLKGLESSLNEVFSSDLMDFDYNEGLGFRAKPFFIEGLWNSSKKSAEILDSYKLPNERGRVNIYNQSGKPIPFYELKLPEFDLPVQFVNLLDNAFQMEIDSAPTHARFAYPANIAQFSEDWYNALLRIVKEKTELDISSSRLRELSKIMSKWLAYRVLEPLSCDEKLTDIYIEAPPELQPIRVVHQDWGTCETGIYWSSDSLLGMAEVLASRLGRSFDEPNPQLDVELPELGLRLFISRYPAIWTKNSASAAIRKRRSKPWTQLLFMERGSITPLASAFVSNLIRKGASMFIIGDIGTAKTSYLFTQIPEIGLSERIIVFQDTREMQFKKFVKKGYEIENVRVRNPKNLQKQVNSFLRGGSAYWLIAEARSSDAITATLAAAARRGSQPILSTFHARTKRQMFDLVFNIMDLHESSYNYIDLIVETAKFETPDGTIRRITEVSEILNEWEEKPKYSKLFSDDRSEDLLKPVNVFEGPEGLLNEISSYDLSNVDLDKARKSLSFLSPGKGGSEYVPWLCKRLAIKKEDFLVQILSEAKMKSELLNKAIREGKEEILELPFVTRSYNKYFSELKKKSPDFKEVFLDWKSWLEGF